MNPFKWWWWQRGILLTCGQARSFHWCVLDNIRHTIYVHRLMLRRRTGWRWIYRNPSRWNGWIADRHARANEQAAERWCRKNGLL